MDIKLNRKSTLASASSVIALAASPAFAWRNCYGVNLKNKTTSPWLLPTGDDGSLEYEIYRRRDLP